MLFKNFKPKRCKYSISSPPPPSLSVCVSLTHTPQSKVKMNIKTTHLDYLGNKKKASG